jgi:NAD(P)-dependent dehydrogenase (short-subunit alcohol dehydrogenase family)
MGLERTDDLGGRHVVVLGGSSGIGLELSRLVREHGGTVTIIARDEQRLAAAAEELGGVNAVAADLREIDTLSAKIAAIGPFDHLVITAGTVAFGTLAQTEPAQWRQILEERIIGPLSVIKTARINEGGSIVLFSGTLAHRPSIGSAPISAAVAGVEALVRALAVELAPLRVNAVAPGLVDTPLLDSLGKSKVELLSSTAAKLPVGRVGEPKDVARLVLHVLTNPYITGTTFAIDGGGRLV